MQLADKADTWWVIWAVLRDGVIDSHAPQLQNGLTYTIQGASVQPSVIGDGAFELYITAGTSICEEAIHTLLAQTQESRPYELVPFAHLAQCQQASAVDIAGVVVALKAPSTVRLADLSNCALDLDIPPSVYRTIGVGAVLAVKQAHVSRHSGITTLFAPTAYGQFAVNPPELGDAVAELRAIADAGNQFKDINAVN